MPSPYLLSGLLYCSCGRALMGHSAKSGRHFYYRCSRKFKQGGDAYAARMLPKDRLERLVIDGVRSRVLTDEKLEELVKLVNEELPSASELLQDRLDAVGAEQRDVDGRGARLYDALETGKLALDDLAPRIQELRERQKQLEAVRLELEARLSDRRVELVDLGLVTEYMEDLRNVLTYSSTQSRGRLSAAS